MRPSSILLPLVAALGLSACATTSDLSKGAADVSSRNVGTLDAIAAQPPVAGDLRVVAVDVTVPQALRVDESQSFYPMNTDIVWRGDAAGDRHAQLAAIFQAAADRAVVADQGAQEVIASVTLERFHGVTERTRFTVGGFYTVHFTLAYRDAATGAPIGAPVSVHRSLAAPGGGAATQLDAQGQTEKVRVTDFLATVMAELFASPPGVDA